MAISRCPRCGGEIYGSFGSWKGNLCSQCAYDLENEKKRQEQMLENQKKQYENQKKQYEEQERHNREMERMSRENSRRQNYNYTPSYSSSGSDDISILKMILGLLFIGTCYPGIFIALCLSYFYDISFVVFMPSAIIMSMVIYGLLESFTKRPIIYYIFTALVSLCLIVFYIENVDESNIKSTYLQEMVLHYRNPERDKNIGETSTSSSNELDFIKKNDTKKAESKEDVLHIDEQENEVIEDYDIEESTGMSTELSHESAEDDMVVVDDDGNPLSAE